MFFGHGVWIVIVDSKDDGCDNIEAEQPPEPAFHVDNLVENVNVVNRDDGFPAWFASLFEYLPASDNEKDVENNIEDEYCAKDTAHSGSFSRG